MRRLLIALVASALAVIVASPAKAITNGEPDRGRHPYVGLALFEAPAGQPSIGAAPACCLRPWS